MKVDLVIANPPYNMGNKIMFDGCYDNNSTADYVILMPLSCYKRNKRYELVKDIEVVDSSLFTDANITKNLSITKLQKEINPNADWKSVELGSFNDKFTDFFELNKGNYITLVDGCAKRFKTPESMRAALPTDYENLIFYHARQAALGIGTEDCFAYKYNHGIIDNSGLPKDLCDGATAYKLVGRLFRLRGKSNYMKWVDNTNLQDLLIKALNKTSGTVERALPQISWETINTHPLWKKGDYDGAVLDVMGLKWNDNHDGVEKKLY